MADAVNIEPITFVNTNTIDVQSFRLQNSTTGLDIDLTGATIACKIKSRSRVGDTIKDFDNATKGGITITGAATGQFRIDEFTWTDGPGSYMLDIKVTSSSGKIRTYARRNLEIVQNIT